MTYVKDERSNLNFMIITWNFCASCEVLGLEEKFKSTYFGPCNMCVCVRKGESL
jgi:hypothetical protein